MGLYYLMPRLTQVLLGTLLVGTLTKMLNHPKGTVTNAFYLMSGSLLATYVFTALLPETVFTPILIYGAQFLLIMKLYDADIFNALLFLFLGFAFGETIHLVFVDFASDFLNAVFA